MAQNGTNLILQWITMLGVIVLFIGSFWWMSAPSVTVDNVDTDTLVEDILSGIGTSEVPVINLTNVENRLDNIETSLDEDDLWKDEAIALATDEWEDRDYRDIFRAIEEIYNGTIDDRDDIEYVKVKDEEVTSFDVDDQDAIVIQKVKVKYEDVNGADQKVYLTITTEIEEGDVEDQVIEETE